MVKRLRTEVDSDYEPHVKWCRIAEEDASTEDLIEALFPEAVLQEAAAEEEPMVRPAEDTVMGFVVSDSAHINDALEHLRSTPGVAAANRPSPEEYPARISALCTPSIEVSVMTLLNTNGDWKMAQVPPMVLDKHPGLYTTALNKTRIPIDLLKTMLGGMNGPKTRSTMPVLKLLYRLYAKRLLKAGMRGANIIFIITMDDMMRLGYGEGEVAWASMSDGWGESVHHVFGVDTTPDGSHAIANPLFNLPKKGYGRVAVVPLNNAFQFLSANVEGRIPEDVMNNVLRFFKGLLLFLTEPSVKEERQSTSYDEDTTTSILTERVAALTARTKRLTEESEAHKQAYQKLAEILDSVVNTLEEEHGVTFSIK